MLYTADVNNVKNILNYINQTKQLLIDAGNELRDTQTEFKQPLLDVLSSLDTDLDTVFDAVKEVVTCVDQSGIVN